MKKAYFTGFYESTTKLNDIVGEINSWVKFVYLKNRKKRYEIDNISVIYIPSLDKIRVDAVINTFMNSRIAQ